MEPSSASTRDIPQHEWTQHKEAIFRLLFQDKLPLRNRSQNGRTVVQVMRDDYGFHARPWQYDKQLKRWGAFKNLTKDDWRTIIPEYDRLKRQGHRPRVRVGDKIFDEKSIKKARRYVRHPGLQSKRTFGPELPPDQTRHWYLEVQQADGQYAEPTQQLRYSELNGTKSPETSAVTRSLADNDLLDVEPQHQEVVPIRQLSSPRQHLMPSSWPDLPSPTTFRPSEAVEDPYMSFSLLIDIPNSPSWHLLPDPLASFPGTFSAASPPVNQYCGPVRSSSPFQQDIPFHSISKQIQDVCGLGVSVPTMWDKLHSLTGEEGTVSLAFITRLRTPMPTSQIHQSIIFSVFNNFAGLEGAAITAILAILRNDSTMRSYLFEGLRSDEISLSKTLAGNLFRLAMRAADEEVLRLVLESTAGSVNEICLNKSTNLSGMDPVPPIVWAIRTCQPAILETLLHAGASVDVDGHCTLSEALEPRWEPGEFQCVGHGERCVLQIVEPLLAHGAKVRPIHCANSTSFHYPQVTELLIQAMMKQHHCGHLMDYQNLFPYNVAEGTGWNLKLMRGDLIESLVQKLVTTCQTSGCWPECVVKHSLTLDMLLTQLLDGASKPAAVYLLNHMAPTTIALIAAIRTQQFDALARMLRHGIRDQVKVVLCFQDLTHSANDCDADFHYPTTPLAEAIRMCDSHLMAQFENYGALNEISNSFVHFEAAAIAAAEVSNRPYLEKILELLTSTHPEKLFRVLMTTIMMGHSDAVKILARRIAQQRTIRPKYPRHDDCLVMCHAIRTRNTEMIDVILEYLEFGDESCCRYTHDLLLKASSWGDVSLVEDLNRMGFRFDWQNSYLPTPLSVATNNGNEQLKSLFLKWGPGACGKGDVVSAIGHQDKDTVRLLLSSGIKIDFEEVSKAIPKTDLSTMRFLLSHADQFSDEHLALRLAVEMKDIDSLRRLLKSIRPYRVGAPLVTAVELGQESMVRVLLNYGQGGCSTQSILAAIKKKDVGLTRLLLGHAIPSDIDRALLEAVKGKDEDMVRLILDHGADPTKLEILMTGLSSPKIFDMLCEALSSAYPTAERIIPVDVIGLAASEGHVGALRSLSTLRLELHFMQYLMSEKAELLHKAILGSEKNESESYDLCRLLLETNLDIEIVVEGRTALLVAVSIPNTQMVDFLLERGSEVNHSARRGLKRTPLQLACELGSFLMVEFLLQRGADINAPPALNAGATALQLAAIQGSAKIITLLLDNEADIHAAPADVHGRTALEGAAEHGRLSALNILLERGAAGYCEGDIRSAKGYAEKSGHSGCEERLKVALFRVGYAGGSRLAPTL